MDVGEWGSSFERPGRFPCERRRIWVLGTVLVQDSDGGSRSFIVRPSPVTPEPKQNPGQESQAEAQADGLRLAIRYWVDHQGQAFELWQGPMTVGRAADCTLVLDDGLVSRRHARFSLEDGVVVVEDLESSNGVLVNGERIVGRCALSAGDQVTIGKQQLTIRAATGVDPFRSRAGRRVLAETIHGTETIGRAEPDPGSGPISVGVRGGPTLELLGGLADKVLAMGRGEEAERMLGGQLDKVMVAARLGQDLDAAVVTHAAGLAVRLAAVTGKGSWLDYAFELSSYLKRPLPAEIVDQLYEVARKVSSVSLLILRDYVAGLRSDQTRFGPAERFLVQRLEGLERIVASK